MEFSVEHALQRAVTAHKEGKLQDAERLYRGILQYQPTHPDANHNLGLIAVSANQVEEALSLFKIALDVNPKFEQFWMSYVDALVQNQQLNDAKRAIKKAKKNGIDTKNLQALFSQSKGMADTRSPSQEQLDSLLDLYQNGQLADAEKLAKSITENFPTHQFSWNLLGVIFGQTGRYSQALVANHKALALAPKDARAHYNLGITLKSLGRLAACESSFMQAITLDPNFIEAHNNLSVILQELGKLKEAEAACKQVIEMNPGFVEAYYNLGVTLKKLGRLEEAEASYRRAIALKPEYADAYSNLGVTLLQLGKLQEAEESCKQAIALNPDLAEAYNNLGNALKKRGKLEEAVAIYTQSIALNADHADAYSNLGVTLQDLGNLNEAEKSCKQAIAINPDLAEAYSNLGNTLQERGKLKEAEANYTQAIALEPDNADAHYNLSFALLKRGRLKEGLDEYEWRWRLAQNLSGNRPFPQPLWDGQESLQGKRILLWSEQGIGDTINWASCLPLIASLAAHTMLECQEKIVSLLARSFPNIEIKPEDRSMDSKRDDFDFHLPMGSLYRHFIPHIGENSNVESYLVPDPVRVKFWRDRLGSLGKGPFIGLAWKSSEVSALRLKHYPPISDWSSVLTIPDVTFINLQYSDFAEDLNDIKNNLGVTVHNFDDLDQYNDVDDVAALCAALDRVVSTKVTPLIFSSGVGTPTMVANWRQSTWNSVLTNPVCSSVEMFHRDTGESWDNVFNTISGDILRLSRKTIKRSEGVLKD